MTYVSANPKKFLNTSVGNGQCVAFVRAAAQVGHTSTWTRGESVRGARLVVGTAIATFDKNGKYANDTSGLSHAAIYLGQDAIGVQVLDQWVKKKHLANGAVDLEVINVHERTLRFQDNASAVNDGRNYYVIE
jgi:hypothetical protein